MTKLLEILVVRHIAPRISASAKPKVIVNTLSPGFCESDFIYREERSLIVQALLKTAHKVIGRTAEVGGRTLVAAAAAGEESHGK